MYKYSVVLGRFEPFHLGHQNMFEKAFKLGEKVVVVLGSARSARTPKNPFTVKEREEMILAALTPEQRGRTTITDVRDYQYNDNLWVTDVQQKVNEITEHERDVCLVGYRKDDSSYYLDLFPQWKFEGHSGANILNATDIRSLYFDHNDTYAYMVPKSTADYLIKFTKTEHYEGLCHEHQFYKDYKNLWASAPYEPTFVTVDAVVIKSGHVLVVKRKAYPGKGLLALPGGFKNTKETVLSAMLRELKEETGIIVPRKELMDSIKDNQVFDHPDRSLRGCTITHAYLIDLGGGSLPKVKGGDDAEQAKWVSYSDAMVNEDKFFEDHASIISHFLWRNN